MSISMWLGVKMLGHTRIDIFPDGSKDVSRQRWPWFGGGRDSPSPPTSGPSQKPWVRTDKKEKNYANWVKGEKESKTKISINIPFTKLCRVGYFQVLDNQIHEPVGMGYPYRGHFIIPLHVWDTVGRAKTLNVRHVCGSETKILTMQHKATYERDSTEEVDDGIAVFILPPGVKSLGADKTYPQAREGAVIMYSYMHGDVYVSSAVALGNKHWASTMPGTSGSPILSTGGGVVGMHTSGGGSSNTMVLTQDIDTMLDSLESEYEEEEEEIWSFIPDTKLKAVVEAVEGKSGKPWKRKQKPKNRRLPKLWTDEEYATYLDQGFTHDQLRTAAEEYWKAHPGEWQRALDDMDTMETRIAFAQKLSFESPKNAPAPPSGGEKTGWCTNIFELAGNPLGESSAMSSIPGLVESKSTGNLTTNPSQTKSQKGSGTGSRTPK